MTDAAAAAASSWADASIWDTVTQCTFHGDLTEGCDACTVELNERRKVLQEMSEETQRRAQGMAQMGVPIQQIDLLQIKIDLLGEVLLGGNVREHLRFEGEFGRRIIGVLKDAQAHVEQEHGKQKLHVPTRGEHLSVIRDGIKDGMNGHKG